MKKQREPLILVGEYIMVDGEKKVASPEEYQAYNNKIAAIIMTLETGIQHTVVA